MIEIGRKSTGAMGAGILGIGTISACFHCAGTMDALSDVLNRVATGSEMKGAGSLKNQDGILSNPIAVGFR